MKHQPLRLKARPQHLELRALLFSISVWVLSPPADHITLKMQETGPTVYSPYPRRLEGNVDLHWTWMQTEKLLSLDYSGPVHTTLEEFENRGFTLKTHQMFSGEN